MKTFTVKSPFDRLRKVDLANLFGVKERTIFNWDIEGLPGSGEGRGRTYVWGEALAWRDARISGSKTSEDDITDKARKVRAEADMAEMEAAKMAGDLLDAHQVEAAWNAFLSRLKTSLDGYPDRAAQALEGLHLSLAERKALLTRELSTLRRDIVAEIRKASEEDVAS